jgi:Methyltransferase domain
MNFMRRILARMPIFVRLFKEFWLATAIACLWTFLSSKNFSAAWTYKDYVNTFGASFFVLSYFSAQFFRVKKQTDVEFKLSRLEANLIIVLDHVKPQNRADSTPQSTYDKVIPLSNVVDFYDAVASLYNNRNRGEYIKTYVEIDKVIRSLSPSLDGISICDIGGGTGMLLRWFENNKVKWTNIDISNQSLKKFKEDFPNYSNKTARICDIRTENFAVNGECFDVIVMSFLLSSLESSPNFNQIHAAMRENSLLVVADNYFEYVQKNPYYGFKAANGNTLAIRPKPVYPNDLRTQFQSLGFVEISYKLVELDNIGPYSQVHVFKKSKLLT